MELYVFSHGLPPLDLHYFLNPRIKNFKNCFNRFSLLYRCCECELHIQHLGESPRGPFGCKEKIDRGGEYFYTSILHCGQFSQLFILSAHFHYIQIDPKIITTFKV